MNKIFIALMSLMLLAGCQKYSNYDKGYEAAWEEENEPSLWASAEEKEGYEDGVDDSDMYDEGYYAGSNRKKPEHINDQFYMEGYNDGKKYR